MRRQLPLIIIVAIYLVMGVLYVTRTPAWQTPDEPAHYNYVRQLSHGRLPVMEDGDYDEAYRNEIVSSRFDPRYDVSVITYEDWQPPLYYLVLLPIYVVSSGSLSTLRLVSLLMGAGIIIAGYAIANLLFPKQPWVGWTTAVIIAFLPQHLAIMGSVNNDALAELIIATLLYLLIRFLIEPPEPVRWRWLLAMGIVLGLGFVTKGTAYYMAPVIGIALLWRYWRAWRRLIETGVAVFAPGFLIGLLWWVRNLSVYGGIDVLGKNRHDEVVVGQIRTAEWISQFGLLETSQRFLRTTFNSFWGQFGWMAVPMPDWIYLPLLLLTILAIVGLLLFVSGRGHADELAAPPHQGTRKLLVGILLLLALLFTVTLGVHVGYNLTFVQHQGRYLFPALIPIALGMALGLGMCAFLVLRSLTPRWSTWLFLLPVGLGLGLILLNLYALWRFIPQL